MISKDIKIFLAKKKIKDKKRPKKDIKILQKMKMKKSVSIIKSVRRSYLTIEEFILMHLRQNFLYSEDVNKNPAVLFVLPYLNVFLTYQYHYLSKKKIYWAKKQRSDDVTFAMMSFWPEK